MGREAIYLKLEFNYDPIGSRWSKEAVIDVIMTYALKQMILLTKEEIKTISDVASMYRSEFGEDSRYDDVKRIIKKLEDFNQE